MFTSLSCVTTTTGVEYTGIVISCERTGVVEDHQRTDHKMTNFIIWRTTVPRTGRSTVKSTVWDYQHKFRTPHAS